MESVVIPNSASKIEDSSFKDNTELKSVLIPSSVTEIGAGAFHGCISLESIIIPNSVEIIGPNAFCGCKLVYRSHKFRYIYELNGGNAVLVPGYKILLYY